MAKRLRRSRPVHIVYSGSGHLSVRVLCFVNWILEVFAEQTEIQLTPLALALALHSNHREMNASTATDHRGWVVIHR